MRPPNFDVLHCRPRRMSLRKQSSWAITVPVSAVFALRGCGCGCAQQDAVGRWQLCSGVPTSNTCFVPGLLAPLSRAGYSMTARGRQRAAAKHTSSLRGSSPQGSPQQQEQLVIADRVQQQLDALGADHVGYAHKVLAGTNISVVGGRPFSKVSASGGQPPHDVWPRQPTTCICLMPGRLDCSAARNVLLLTYCGCAGGVGGCAGRPGLQLYS